MGPPLPVHGERADIDFRRGGWFGRRRVWPVAAMIVAMDVKHDEPPMTRLETVQDLFEHRVIFVVYG